MIQVNLLPPEHRAPPGTPIVRFATIVAGVALFIGTSSLFAYTHFIQLARVKDVQAQREEEAANKDAQRARSLALAAEATEKAQRRTAIQAINRNRVLWSKKLDQFYDIVAGRDTPYSAWLEELEVPTQMAANRRAGGLSAAPDGGQVKFSGFLAMNSPNEAPAQNSAFYKSMTGDPEVTNRTSEFFADFSSISNPTIDILPRLDERTSNLTPPVVGAFKYELRLKPPSVDGAKAAGAK